MEKTPDIDSTYVPRDTYILFRTVIFNMLIEARIEDCSSAENEGLGYILKYEAIPHEYEEN